MPKRKLTSEIGAVEHSPGGLCPWIYNHPLGKQIPISFIGPEPYIKYPTPANPNIGGSEFEVIKILATKFRFLPKPKPEKAFDVVKTNTSTYGMLYSVRISNTGRPLWSETTFC